MKTIALTICIVTAFTPTTIAVAADEINGGTLTPTPTTQTAPKEISDTEYLAGQEAHIKAIILAQNRRSDQLTKREWALMIEEFHLLLYASLIGFTFLVIYFPAFKGKIITKCVIILNYAGIMGLTAFFPDTEIPLIGKPSNIDCQVSYGATIYIAVSSIIIAIIGKKLGNGRSKN